MDVEFERVDWRYVSPHRIAYKSQTLSQTVVVKLADGSFVGRGEALGVSYHGETATTIWDQLEAVKKDLRGNLSRRDLAGLLPAGGARNAVDCALWDLEAKRSGQRAWRLAGLHDVHPLLTAYTLGIDTPEAMGAAAGGLRQYSLLKVKLAGDDDDVARVATIRKLRPDADIIVDANQSWSEEQLWKLTPRMAELGVKLIEQPLPVGKDEALAGFRSPVPLCADESCQVADSLPALVGKYQFVNIKLDKTGGMTEAFNLVSAAQKAGFKLMIGCMGGSSLSMAPGFLVGQFCDVVDLDGPPLLTSDVPHGIRYDGSVMMPPEMELWG
ncbi:MAG: N-acetyl-D-Glu racemase DgcA [Rhizomicrobium sp.]